MGDVKIDVHKDVPSDTYRVSVYVDISYSEMQSLGLSLLNLLSSSLAMNQTAAFKFFVLEKICRALGK